MIPASPPQPAPKTSERLLLESFGELKVSRVFCTSLGRAQLAASIADRCRDTRVTCNFLDLYPADQSRQLHAALPNLTILCQADLPAEEFDQIELPLAAQGDAELTRDLLQASHLALRVGGVLRAATDNPRDHWLRTELAKLFDKISAAPQDDGVVYRAVKSHPLKKQKNYGCEFAFRDQGRLLKAFSRPGVFSHRKIDTGARALIEAMLIQPGDRVLDLGCGSGVVSLAAATRAEQVQVLALDSNPRAVACTRRGAELNGLTNIRVQLDADARCDEPGTFAVVLANPPYFSRHRIAEIFLTGAAAALKPGGQLFVVTKDADWFCDAMSERFQEITVLELRRYFIVQAHQPL